MTRYARVAQVREALSRLLPGDMLITNQVSNLAIERDKKYIGYVALANLEIQAAPSAELILFEEEDSIETKEAS